MNVKPTEYNAAERLFQYAEVLRGVLTDEVIDAMRDRNEERRQAAIAELGSRWVGVPQ